MPAADLTVNDYDVLCHALGLNSRESVEYRNHYVSDGMSPRIQSLVAAGLMEERPRPGFLAEDYRVFAVTERGRVLAHAEHARRFPTLSRAKARYLAFLRARDSDPDLTFRDFLREVPDAR